MLEIRKQGRTEVAVRITDARSLVVLEIRKFPVQDRWEKLFDLSYLPAGVYFLSVVTDEGPVRLKVVILK
jgi:hypothetical protein